MKTLKVNRDFINSAFEGGDKWIQLMELFKIKGFEKLIYKGDLWLSLRKSESDLYPDNIEVIGNFKIGTELWGDKNDKLPSKLEVTGDLDLLESNIENLDTKLCIGGDLMIHGVKIIGKNVTVGGVIYAHTNRLISIPEHLKHKIKKPLSRY